MVPSCIILAIAMPLEVWMVDRSVVDGFGEYEDEKNQTIELCTLMMTEQKYVIKLRAKTRCIFYITMESPAYRYR